MFDPQTVDKMFEAGVHLAIFDKRILLPWQSVATEVLHKTGDKLTFEDIIQMGSLGWIPILRCYDYPEEIGFPLYVSLRIILLQELERNGYSAEELHGISTYEEGLIDYVLTVDHMSYIDDSVELLIQHTQEELSERELLEEYSVLTHETETTLLPRDGLEQKLRTLQRFQQEGVPEKYQDEIPRWAYRICNLKENVRLIMIEKFHGKIRAEYSPYVQFSSSSWGPLEGDFTGKGIFWKLTVETALTYAKDNIPLIRVPGFLLREDKIVSTKTLSPREYESLWKQHDLDEYLLAWSRIQGEKICRSCLTKLEDLANIRRMYCSEKCRNVAKQKRYRERNPEAIFEAQKKYWSTLDS